MIPDLVAPPLTLHLLLTIQDFKQWSMPYLDAGNSIYCIGAMLTNSSQLTNLDSHRSDAVMNWHWQRIMIGNSKFSSDDQMVVIMVHDIVVGWVTSKILDGPRGLLYQPVYYRFIPAKTPFVIAPSFERFWRQCDAVPFEVHTRPMFDPPNALGRADHWTKHHGYS